MVFSFRVEEKVAQEILRELKQSIRESLSVFDGADSDYYQRFYQYFYHFQKKIAKLCGLPLSIVQDIATLIGKQKILPIGKKLVEERVQYDVVANSEPTNSRERDRLRVKEKEIEESEEEELDKEDEYEEEINADILVKMLAQRQKKDAREILKRLLICMIAARMDPRRRAGETLEGNARHARIYGREKQVSLKDLVHGGLVSSAVLKRLNAQGISGNASLSVSKIQSFVAAQFSSIINLVRGSTFEQVSTKIPSQSQGLLTLAKVNNNLAIFSQKAADVSACTNLNAGFTPFVESQSKGGGRGR